jgi:hypothetical protein
VIKGEKPLAESQQEMLHLLAQLLSDEPSVCRWSVPMHSDMEPGMLALWHGNSSSTLIRGYVDGSWIGWKLDFQHQL